MKFLILFFLVSSCNIIKVVTGKDSNLDPNFVNQNLYLNIYSSHYDGRTIFVDDEVEPRTMYFDYTPGATLSCSTDQGTTFFDCTGNQYVWSIGSLNVNHIVRAKLNDKEIERNFIPSDFVPGIQFVSCDHNVTSETITTFNGRVFMQNEVVCFEDMAEITGVATLDIMDSGLILIARQNNYAIIKSTVQGAVLNSATTDVKIVGIDIEGDPAVAGQTGINSSQSITIEDVHISIPGNTSKGISVGGLNTTIRGAQVYTNDTNSSIGIYNNNSNLELFNSYISSGVTTVFFFNNSGSNVNFNIYNSALHSENPTPGLTGPGVFESYSNSGMVSNISFNNSQITTDFGNIGILVKGGTGYDNITVNNTYFINNDLGGTQSSPAIQFDDDVNIDSIAFDHSSFICNMGTGSTFSQIISLANNSISPDVTVMDAHTGNLDIGLCGNIDTGTGTVNMP